MFYWQWDKNNTDINNWKNAEYQIWQTAQLIIGLSLICNVSIFENLLFLPKYTKKWIFVCILVYFKFILSHLFLSQVQFNLHFHRTKSISTKIHVILALQFLYLAEILLSCIPIDYYCQWDSILPAQMFHIKSLLFISILKTCDFLKMLYLKKLCHIVGVQPARKKAKTKTWCRYLNNFYVPVDCWTDHRLTKTMWFVSLSCRQCSGGHGWGHEADGRCEGLSGHKCQTKLYWPPAESTGQGPQRNHGTLQ